jgi:hypothetical protein
MQLESAGGSYRCSPVRTADKTFQEEHTATREARGEKKATSNNGKGTSSLVPPLRPVGRAL